MKALTLHQPWASLIAIGAKRIETRGWGTRYRGTLLIHASKRKDWVPNFFETGLILRMEGLPELPDPIPFGCVVAAVKLVDCRKGYVPENRFERTYGNYGPSRYAWFLDAVTPLERPIAWKGAQGLWEPPPELARLVLEQVGDNWGEPDREAELEPTMQQGKLF